MHTQGKVTLVGDVWTWIDPDTKENVSEYCASLEFSERARTVRIQSFTSAEHPDYSVGPDETHANAVRLAQLWNLADGLDMADIATALEGIQK
jgi:hypothetical protein